MHLVVTARINFLRHNDLAGVRQPMAEERSHVPYPAYRRTRTRNLFFFLEIVPDVAPKAAICINETLR